MRLKLGLPNAARIDMVATCCLAALAVGALTVARAAAQDHPPNIVWISAEDLSPRLGSYGDPIAETPNLDQFAAEGMRFTRAFVTQPICAPNRSAIITGVYPTSLGTHHMRTTDAWPGLPGPYLAVPPPYVKAFTEYLRAAGYYTTNNSKTDYQFAPHRDPQQPVSAWDESSDQAHWRNRPDSDMPFFSVFNIMTTHESHVWPDHPVHEGKGPITDPATVEVPPYYPDTLPIREDLARHYDNIARVDRRVGEILQQLEQDGLEDNTIVFFWTDHGDGLPRAKRWLYDSGLHVPLIIRWPGQIEPGSVNDELMSFVDLAPTVLSMAGVEVPAHMQGRILVGDHEQAEPEYIFASRDRVDTAYDMVRAVRDRRFKYIRNFYPELPYVLHVPYRNRGETMQELLRLSAARELTGPPALWLSEGRPPEELYDTQEDPHEINNLAGNPSYSADLVRMRKVLDDWMIESRDWGLVPEAEMVSRMWPGGDQPQTATPVIVPRTATELVPATGEGYVFDTPVEVVIHVPTQGASIEYTTEEGEDAAWKLYKGPLRVSSSTAIRARAIRYGYALSDESAAQISIR